MLDQARTREIHEEARQQHDPQRRLEMIAYQNRCQWEFGGTMIAIHEGAAAVDLEAAAELREVLGGRRRVMTRFVAEMKDALRPDVDAGDAAAILLALAQPAVYRELVEVAGVVTRSVRSLAGRDFERAIAPRSLSGTPLVVLRASCLRELPRTPCMRVKGQYPKGLQTRCYPRCENSGTGNR